MIVNVILAMLAMGWAINSAVFQARGNHRMWVINAVIATSATAALTWRLS